MKTNLIVILLFFIGFNLFSKERAYKDETIKSLKEEYRYGQAPEEKQEEPKPEEEKKKDEISFPMGDIMLILFAAIVIAFVIALFVRFQGTKFTFKEKKEKIEAEETLDEFTTKSELEDALDKALMEENMRLAIRITFLLAVQNLDSKDLIVVEKSKTIPQYLFELDGKKARSPFSELSYLFNYVWYGGFEVDKANYETAHNYLKEIEKST